MADKRWEIKCLWVGDCYCWLLYVDGEHVLSAYRPEECHEELRRRGLED